MRTPYGLKIIEDCLSCPLIANRPFCNLPKSTLADLDSISSAAMYSKGAIIFLEGQEPLGAFVLCNGRVKMSATSSDGKSLIFRVAQAGEVIGVPGALSNKPYELTAEALEPTQANFIRRADFLQFLQQHGDAAMRVAELMVGIYQATCDELRNVGLSSTAREKLARFLLTVPAEHTAGLVAGPSTPSATAQLRGKLTLTHQEIASQIGVARETVTRGFTDFKKKRLIDVRGSTLILLNPPALAEMVPDRRFD